MTSASTLLRSLAIYGLCLPLAVFLGYLLASPPDLDTVIVLSVLMAIITLPLFLRWHHAWLIASWNMTANIFFLPGRPSLWIGLTAISLLISAVQYALRRERNYLPCPSMAWPLLLLAIVTLVTAELAGGIGLRSLGGDVVGGKRYFYIFAAIAGFFAITARPIPDGKAAVYVILFFLGTGTQVIGDLAGHLHPAFRFIFLIFPVENILDLSSDFVVNTRGFMRSGGLTMLSLGIYCAMLARYGLKDLLSLQHPLRLLSLGACMFVGLLGGYRSLLIQFFLIAGVLFYLEGLYRSRVLPALVICFALGATLLGGFATSLPLSIQRTFAFLPINIDPEVKMDAEFSSEWRLRMWEEVIPQIPKYLLVGKGYAMSGRDTELVAMGMRGAGHEVSELAGDYHNGPLSVIVPLGIFGAIAVVWMLAAGGRVVYRNYKYGSADLKRLNTFIFAFYVAKVIHFLAVFGSFYVDLPAFTGLIALSISLNRGVASRTAPAPEPSVIRLRLSPALRGSPAP